MTKALVLDDLPLRLEEAANFIFQRQPNTSIEVAESALDRVRKTHSRLYELMEKKLPIYGVTTGFGDSCFRVVSPSQSEALQKNLISYLLCGTGPVLSEDAARATFLFRLKSLSRGFSGVSVELLNQMKLFLERDWIPVIPREGSLGASGDLIPLAYIAQALQGEGKLYDKNGGTRATAETLKAAGVAPYTLKPKEGLALVNGTSAMAGLALTNINNARYLLDLSALSTSWLVLALKGRTEPFSELVNERAKAHEGQAHIARQVRSLLHDEHYSSKPLSQVVVNSSSLAEEMIQDRYSLRCAPQILGPVAETMSLVEGWIETEINGTSDNPLIDEDGNLAMGGNFYGGHLSQGMDYLKISLAHMADLLDRQLMTLIDDKTNRGLPANLANWPGLPEEERFLHHGLKGLHQATNAITSEILARATPNGIFSRSSESHNQDKVSLGMSAAVQCSEMIEPLFTIQSMYLVCLAQALDLRGITLKGASSRAMYQMIRDTVPFITHDIALGESIQTLSEKLKDKARLQGRVFGSL